MDSERNDAVNHVNNDDSVNNKNILGITYVYDV